MAWLLACDAQGLTPRSLATLICYVNDMLVDSHHLARAVARLNRRLRQERDSDLTPTQLSVLGTLWALGPSTPGAIATRERVQPPSVTRTLTGLLHGGYVEREPHPDDGRQVVISLSDKGVRVLEEERKRRDVWLSDRLDALPPADRELLVAATTLLEQLANE